MYYDLHVHTHASDGAFSPQKILDICAETGVPGLAITDHDTVNGLSVAKLYKEAKELKLELVYGIELNTDWGESEVHILGYFIDFEDKRFQNQLKVLKEARYDRALKMIKRLNQLGISIDISEVEQICHGELIGRPHIARVMIAKKYVANQREAFQRYIGIDAPAYVPRYKFTTQDAIDLINTVNGIPVLAHPGLVREQDKIKMIINKGIKGIEVFYPEHNYRQVKNYLETCSRFKLLVTGGTDFHSFDIKNRCQSIGEIGINEEQFLLLKNYFHNKAKNE